METSQDPQDSRAYLEALVQALMETDPEWSRFMDSVGRSRQVGWSWLDYQTALLLAAAEEAEHQHRQRFEPQAKTDQLNRMEKLFPRLATDFAHVGVLERVKRLMLRAHAAKTKSRETAGFGSVYATGQMGTDLGRERDGIRRLLKAEQLPYDFDDELVMDTALAVLSDLWAGGPKAANLGADISGSSSAAEVFYVSGSGGGGADDDRMKGTD